MRYYEHAKVGSLTSRAQGRGYNAERVYIPAVETPAALSADVKDGLDSLLRDAVVSVLPPHRPTPFDKLASGS